MLVSAPGKVLMMGGYAVLEYLPSYSIAVEDVAGLGVVAKAKLGERRLISRQFSIDISPNDITNPASAAYLVAEEYLKAYGFQPTSVELSNSQIFGREEEKSGLGSSAASIVATIASMFVANGFSLDENRDKVHILSQVANAIYSGKIGSGYDVASSSYGSIRYVRFSSHALDGIELQNIASAFERDWSPLFIERKLPPWEIAIFNIKGKKTSTISSVKLYREAKATYPEKVNEFILGQSRAEAKALEAMEAKDKELFRKYLHEARHYQRKLSSLMKAIEPSFEGIEPEPLSSLIDSSENMEGVVAGRCHGGGGWDGVAFFVEESFDPKAILELANSIGLELEHIDVRVNDGGVKVV